jgi:outer membrane autotransporter protein
LFWNPELHIAATYDMLSDAAMAVVTIPGASAYTIESENLSRLGGEFGFGITAEYYYLTVSLNYDLNVHQDYTSHTGSLKLKYKF